MDVTEDILKIVKCQARKVALRHGCDFDEAFSDALLSTVLAHRSYDPTKGAKLTTWISNNIQLRATHHLRKRLQAVKTNGDKWRVPRFAVIDGLALGFYDSTFEKVAIAQAAEQTFRELLKENRLRDRSRAIILRCIMRGETHEIAARQLGVTRQRVQQIVKEFPDWRVRMLQKLHLLPADFEQLLEAA